MIRAERIQSDIEAIARCTQTPGGGATRPTFSAEWARARDYVAEQTRRCGCQSRIDAAGNFHARPVAFAWDKPAWLCGSHIDTVPHGGDFDGVAGVVVGLELLRSGAEDGLSAFPIELIIFAEEEGTTFGHGMLGSRAWAGDLDAKALGQYRDSDGQSYLEAGEKFGVDPARLATERIQAPNYLGLIEVHIEQGPGLWLRNERLAIVSAIAGRRQMLVKIAGQANHAGATSMSDRKDALSGAAACIVGLESLARAIGKDAVLTVGRIVNLPNAINVIPDRVEFTIDFRGGDNLLVEAAFGQICTVVENICQRRELKSQVFSSEQIGAQPMDAKLIERLQRISGAKSVTSGALHDSAILAPHIPTAMLFVPSRDGISHNPAEFSRVEDIAAAAGVVEKLFRRPTIAQLNCAEAQKFVEVCGGIFEQSPWIAQMAWDKRPFASVGDLFEKLCAVVANSSKDRQLDLVKAHPDLVGRLARQGRVTRESQSEQAAAGLSDLSESEIAAFERFNQQYREKFGFPFVICARQNRKEAILAAFPRRLSNSPAVELATALEEINKIARLRLADAVWED